MASQVVVLTGRTLGGLIVGDLIDEGGHGRVYRAKQRGPERDAVIKVMHGRLSSNADAEMRFLNEGKIAARLDHPFAAHVYAVGWEREEDLLWIAMEFVDGVTLHSWLLQHGPMPLGQFVSFFDGVAQVVDAAHDRGIVHRDLKPGNIMVVERMGRLLPKLLDFGVAKLLDVGLADRTPTVDGHGPAIPRCTPNSWTSASTVVGSFPYMPKEQWDDSRSVGPVADNYALGVLAYEALTGRRPFDTGDLEITDNVIELGEMHRSAPVPPLGPGFPVVLDRIFQRALAKRPEDRFQTASEFAAALREAHETTEAEMAIKHEQLWRVHGHQPQHLLPAPAAQKLAALEEKGELSHEYLRALKPFVGASLQRTKTRRWQRIAGILAGALVVVGAGGRTYYRQRAEVAKRIGDARLAAATTQAEIEQGRQLLLLGKNTRAADHLREAHRLGDSSWSTDWMFSRATEPQRAELARLPAIKGRMWSVTISPNGGQIVTTDQGGAQIWDGRTYKLLYKLPHADVVYDAAFTPDGAQVATASGDGVVRIWDAGSGRLVRELKTSGSKRWRKLAIVGHAVVAVDFVTSGVFAWDASSGALIGSIANPDDEIWLLSVSADGRWLATGGGGDAQIVDTSTWKVATRIPGRIHRMAWDPTGPRLVTGSDSGDVSIRDLTGAVVRRIRDVGPMVDALAYSPDGKLIAQADRDEARVWSVRGDLVSQLDHHATRVRSMIFDASSSAVAIGGDSGAVTVFDVPTGIATAAFDEPKAAIWSMQIDATSTRVVAASWDGVARVWDSRSLYRRWASPQVASSCKVASATAPDSRYVAVACDKHVTRIWDTLQDRLLAELPGMEAKVPGDSDFSSVLPVTSDDGTRAAVARGNTAELYELPGGRLLRTIVHAAPVSALAFGSGRDVLTGATDGTIQLTHDGQPPIELPPAAAGIDAVGVLSDGRVVATDAAKHLRVISAGAAEVLDAPTRITLLRPSHDGMLVGIQGVTIPSLAGQVGAPSMWSFRGRARLVGQLLGHEGNVFSARWDGTRVFTAGSDGSVRLWSDDAASVRIHETHAPRLLIDVAVSPDGKLVAGGGADGLVTFWDAATGRELWSLRTHVSQVIGLHFEGADLVTRGFGGDVARWHLAPAADVIRGMVQK